MGWRDQRRNTAFASNALHEPQDDSRPFNFKSIAEGKLYSAEEMPLITIWFYATSQSKSPIGICNSWQAVVQAVRLGHGFPILAIEDVRTSSG